MINGINNYLASASTIQFGDKIAFRVSQKGYLGDRQKQIYVHDKKFANPEDPLKKVRKPILGYTYGSDSLSPKQYKRALAFFTKQDINDHNETDRYKVYGHVNRPEVVIVTGKDMVTFKSKNYYLLDYSIVTSS